MWSMFFGRLKTVLRDPKPNTQAHARTSLKTSLKHPEDYRDAEGFFKYTMNHPYMTMHECVEAYYDEREASRVA